MSLKRILTYASLAVCTILLLALACVFLLLNTTSGANWLVSRASSTVNNQSALTLEVEDVNGNLATTLSLQGIVFSSGDSATVNMEQLDISISLWALLTERTIHLKQLSVGNTTVSTTASGNEPGTPPDIEGILQSLFSLPVAFVLDEVSLSELVLNEQLTLSADLSDTRLSEAGLELDQLTVSFNQIDLNLAGFTLQPDLSTQGALNWQTDINEDNYAGQLTFSGPLNNLDIEHNLSSPLQVATVGQVRSLLTLTPDFSLQHSAVIPTGFMGIPEQLSNAELELTTSGTPDNIDLTASAETSVTDVGLVEARLEADWSSSENQVAINLLELDREGDRLTMNGLLTLAPVLQFEADWQVDTSSDLALPADMTLNSVTGEGSISLALDNSAAGMPNIELTVARLSGSLNDYELAADGNIALADNSLQRVNLNLVQQDNQVTISGDRSSGEEIRFDLEIPSLQALLPVIQGQLTGSGTLTGSVNEPVLNTVLTLDGFAYPDQSLTLEQLSIDFFYAGAQSLTLSADALSFSYGPLPEDIENVALSMDGSPDSHTIELALNSALADITLSGSGQLMGSDYLLNLDLAQLASVYGDWALQEPVTVDYTDGNLTVSSHCWQYTSLEACLSLDMPAASLPQAEFSASNLPLQWLIRDNENMPPELSELLSQAPMKPAGVRALQQDYQLWLPANAFIDGAVSFSGRVGPGADNMLDINAVIEPDTIFAGLVRTEENEDDLLTAELNRFEVTYNELSFSRTDGNIASAFSISVVRDSADSGLAQGTFEGSLSMDTSQALAGSVSFDFPELGWTESMVSLLETPAGELGGEIQFAGTLDQPRFITDINLDNGSTLLPEYGLNLQNIQASLNSDNSNRFRFSVQGESGEGMFRLDGDILEPFQTTRTLELSLQGENVEAMNTPGTRVIISPDINAELSSNALLINGDVHIPTMSLTLDEDAAGNSKTSVSSDVIVRNSDQDDTLRMAENSTSILRLPINGTVNITLGEEVSFTGFGLNMSLAGGVELEKTPQRPLLANGELTVTEGSYEFYGQRLTTENGHLLFLGNPSNPAIDVRATREVDDITVGMQISGTVSDVQGQLFSSPTLPESEILAMLITGKSLSGVNSQEGSNMMAAIARFGIDKGQGLTGTVQDKLGLDALELNTGRELSDSSVGLGKYLTPDLYMSYKIGLFDNESVLSLDYTLTDRLKLEVETGISQSIDLTYTVEK